MISPRYCVEDISYLKIPKLKRIAFPMKCFCDINMHRLDVHLGWYGYYGLAFSKEWGMSRGIQPIGKSIYFEFQATYHMSLFGVEKDLPCIIGIFDSKLTNYTVKGNKYKLLLDHLSDEQHMYTSTLRFATEDALQTYMGGDRNDIITALHSAKTPEDFLAEKSSQDLTAP